VKDIAIMERTELNIRALCDTRVPRFLGLYHIYDCQEEKDEIAACRPELLRRPGLCNRRKYAVHALALGTEIALPVGNAVHC
jgi:hypothetical protein